MCFWTLGEKLPDTHPKHRQRGARWALTILSCINLLNYADRYVPSAVKPMLKQDLDLTDLQTALPATGMTVVYMVFGMIFGHLADAQLCDRRYILAAAVVAWSAATAVAGASQNFTQLLVFRSLVGVGEAAFTTIVPPLLADFYPARDRSSAFTIFIVCAPLGGAIGYIFGSWLAVASTWRIAFLGCGIPGVVVAFLILGLNDPVRGINDTAPSEEKAVGTRELNSVSAFFRDFWEILTVPHWFVGLLALILCSFTVGAMTDWYDTLLVRTFSGVGVQRAGLMLGITAGLGGIGGALSGNTIVQAFKSRWPNAWFGVPALFMIPSGFCILLAVNIQSSALLAFIVVLVGWWCFMTHQAPLQTVMVTSIPVHLRSRASGIALLLCHALGTVISPPIVGAISDATDSLRRGMQVTWVVALLAGVVLGAGALALPPPPGLEEACAKGPEVGSASVWELFRGGGEAERDAAGHAPEGYGATKEA